MNKSPTGLNANLARSMVIILAAGSGSRFRSEKPKQFLKLAGKTVLEHTLDVFEQHLEIDEVILVTSAEHLPLVEELVTRAGYRKPSRILRGGETRQESSACGIATIIGDNHKVLVHDAARPMLDGETICRCLDALDEYEAVDTAIPTSDTIIQVDISERIVQVPERRRLRLGQTPQAFRSGILRDAHKHFSHDANPPEVTDDCGLVLHYQLAPIKVVEGNVNNAKITYPSDIYLADRLFQLRSKVAYGDQFDTALLRSKVIVVFGASRGIGAHICSLAEQADAHVIAVSRSSGINVCNEADVRRTLRQAKEKFGHIDSVILTAGVLRTGLLIGQDYTAIDEQLNTNIRGSVVVAREAFEAMRDSGGGSIALFTSSSYTRGRARSAVYSATKAAVVNLMQGLSEEFKPFNVRINAINPERTATPMRTENFGNEPAETLLEAGKVAWATLASCVSQSTGDVVDVRRS